MKNALLLLLLYKLFLGNLYIQSQLTIDNTSYSVSELVSTVLIPAADGTVISNVQFSGVYNLSSRYQIGYFSTATTTRTQMGFNSGVMLTSGNTSEIPLSLGTNPRSASQVSRNYTSCSAGEIRKSGTCGVTVNDLNILSGGANYFNVAILEFDFVPLGGAVAFRYIFGSEEYEDDSELINYQCSDFNDRFAFLISGTGITGGQGYDNDARNIARLADGSIVAINSVNNGVVGSSGGSPNASKCVAANASWVNGSPASDYLGTIDGTQMNGNTKILTAYQAGLTPGQTYHIKMIIMDVSDGAYDSVVYLEEGSFITDPILLPVELLNFEAHCNDEAIQLAWTTATERNNDFFTIERMNFFGEFELIANVNGSNNSSTSINYSFFDYNATIGTNYYRLFQTDFDGTKTFLSQFAFDNNCFGTTSPFHDAYFNTNQNTFEVSYTLNNREKIDVHIFDQTGKLIQFSNLEANPSQQQTSISISKNISNGIYYLKLSNQNFTWNKKIVVIN